MTTDTLAPEDIAAYERITQPPAGLVTLRAEDHTGATLAAADKSVVTGVALLKPGTFNGTFEVDRDDLDAYVERFNALRGVFRPPMRIDHSWEVTNVIGRFIDLRVENRPDDTIGGTVVPMLVGDIRLVGTAAEKAQLREWIADGKLDERSVEMYPYRTNTGAEYPLVFAGAAFVDIPAVEGLGGITLRRATLAADTTEQGEPIVPNDDPQTPAPVDPPEPVDPPVVADPPVEDPEAQPDPAGSIVIADPDPEPDPEDPPVGEVPPADANVALRAALAAGDEAAVLRAAERIVEERVTLRTEADHRIKTFRAAGVMPPGIATQAEALLRHADKTVRDSTAAILSAARPPVALRDERGARTSVAPGGARSGEFIALTMTPDEANAAYAEAYEGATPEQRAQLRAELKAWQLRDQQ